MCGAACAADACVFVAHAASCATDARDVHAGEDAYARDVRVGAQDSSPAAASGAAARVADAGAYAADAGAYAADAGAYAADAGAYAADAGAYAADAGAYAADADAYAADAPAYAVDVQGAERACAHVALVSAATCIFVLSSAFFFKFLRVNEHTGWKKGHSYLKHLSPHPCHICDTSVREYECLLFF